MPQEISGELVEIIKLLGAEPEPEGMGAFSKDEYLQKLKKQILQLKDDTASKKIGELEEDINRQDSRYVDRRPYLTIFLSYAYSVKDLNRDALIHAQKVHQYQWDNKWDIVLYNWFLGVVYRINGLSKEASDELTVAQGNLEQYCTDAQKRHKEKRVSKCINVIEEIKQTIKNLPERIPQPSLSMAAAERKFPGEPSSNKGYTEPTPTGQFKDPGKKAEGANDNFDRTAAPASATEIVTVSPVSTSENITPATESYILIPWIPIYEDVQAGADGLIWIDPPNRDKTELHQVFLQDKQCNVYPTHTSSRRIVINNERQYAWAKVRGHSMEQATPTPIQENDYVLFYTADATEIDNIVIVAQYESGADNSHMVKRIDLEGKMFISQTNRTGAEYEPIPFNPERYCIVGIVVAVAKSR